MIQPQNEGSQNDPTNIITNTNNTNPNNTPLSPTTNNNNSFNNNNNTSLDNEILLNIFPQLRNLINIFADGTEREIQMKTLKLVKNVYLKGLTPPLEKYELYDWENYSYLQRSCLIQPDVDTLASADEVIALLLMKLKTINLFSISKNYKGLRDICLIVEEFSSLCLISNQHMVTLTTELDRILSSFSVLEKQRSHMEEEVDDTTAQVNNIANVESTLSFSIIKILRNFIYTYNDRIIHSIYTDKATYALIDDIDINTVRFIFDNSDLGQLISRVVVRIMSVLQRLMNTNNGGSNSMLPNPIINNNNNNNDNNSINKIHVKIMRHSMTILNYLISNYDGYILSLKAEYAYERDKQYLSILSLTETSSKAYALVKSEQANIINAYIDYFNRKTDEDGLIQTLNKIILNIIVIKQQPKGTKATMSKEHVKSVIKTNFFHSISRVLEILYNQKSKPLSLRHKEFIDNLFEFYKAFITDNADNALLVLSHHLFKRIIKVPIDYGIDAFNLFYECIQLIQKTKPVLSFTKHILKNLFEYLLELHMNKYNKIKSCLLLFLSISKMLILETKCLRVEIVVNKMKQILTKLNQHFKIVNILLDKSLHKNENEINLDNTVFLIYFKLINGIFNLSDKNDKTALNRIINVDKVISYLKENHNLPIRAELLRYLRKNLIDLEYADNADIYYTNAIINSEDKLSSIKNNPLISNFHYPTMLLSFQRDLFNIAKMPEVVKDNTSVNIIKSNEHVAYFDMKSFELIKAELEHFDVYVEHYKNNTETNNKNLRNYFENGIIIPAVSFLKKAFAYASNLTGKEVLDLRDLVVLLLNTKLKIINFKRDFWENTNTRVIPRRVVINNNKPGTSSNNKTNSNNTNTNGNKDDNEEDDDDDDDDDNDEDNLTIKGYNDISSCINGEFCHNDQLRIKTEKDLQKLNSKKHSPQDYTFLFQIVNDHLFSLIKHTPLSSIADDFDNKSEIINLKGLKKLELSKYPLDIYNQLEDNQKRLIRTIIIYSQRKLGLTNESSSLLTCLSESSLEFKMDLRKILINVLIRNGKVQEQFTRDSYFILFKMLSLQTTETQSTVIDLLGGEESEQLGFMSDFANHLFNRLVRIFIDDVNPHDRVMNIEYITAYSLIKVFKFLCEEHNNFFQGRLIKGLVYRYVKMLPDINNCEDTTNQTIDNSKCNNKKKTTQSKFFDFMLHCLLKVILISEWDSIANISTSGNSSSNNSNEQLFQMISASCDNKVRQKEYLFDLFAAIIELLVEVIQGNKPEFLSCLGNDMYNMDESLIFSDCSDDSMREDSQTDSFQTFVEANIDLVFRSDVENKLVYQIRDQLMQLLTAVLEEKNCNEEMQKFIIRHLNLSRVISSISALLKSYFAKQNKFNNASLTQGSAKFNFKTEIDYGKTKIGGVTRVNDTKVKMFYKGNSGDNEHERYQKLKFDHILYNYFKDEYYKSNNLSESTEFELANIFYRYIKLISVGGKSPEATKLITKVNAISEEEGMKRFGTVNESSSSSLKSTTSTTNTKAHSSSKFVLNKPIVPNNLINESMKMIDSDFIEKFYIIKFFEGITRTVEVRTEDKTNRNQTVIYTILPEMIYLSTGTKLEFVATADRDSEASKKGYLIRHVGYFQKEIKYYKKRRDRLTILFASMNFTYIQVFLYLYAVVLNLFMLFTLTGDMRINSAYKADHEEKVYISSLINESIDKWSYYYNILAYLYCGLNGIFVLLWVIFRMPLYYRLDKIKFMEQHKITKKSDLTIWNKIYIALYYSVWVRDYITSLIYLFVVSLVGSIMVRGEPAYPFLLLAIMNLNSSLKTIIQSVKNNYRDLITNYVLMIIVMYFYSNLGFFFFNDDFNTVIDDIEDNYCSSLVFCFMSVLNQGLRNRGGVGDLMTRISFLRNTKHYIGRIFYDVTFFLLIVIIMIDLVFGVIIDGFMELSTAEEMHREDRENHCFICNVERKTMEKNRKNFDEHREGKHNLWNYVNYMVFLTFANLHDLNAINSYAKDKMSKGDIRWLPTFKDEEKKNDELERRQNLDEDFKVEEENINFHVVKES